MIGLGVAQLKTPHDHGGVNGMIEVTPGQTRHEALFGGIVLPVCEQLSTERQWFSTVVYTHGRCHWRIFAPVSPVLVGSDGMTPSYWGTNTCGEVLLKARNRLH